MPGFSGQGKVYIGERLPVGNPPLLRWLGNASVFRIGQNEDTVERKESYTGNRLPNRRMTRSRGGEITITFDEFSKENMAWAMLGENTLKAANAGPVDEQVSTGVINGDVWFTRNKNITITEVRDISVPTPKVLVPATNYNADPFAGSVEFVNTSTGGPYIQPFHVIYSYGSQNVVGAFKLLSPEVYLRMDGVNTDDNSRVIVDVFRTRLSPARQVDLINDDFNDFELAGSLLADMTRAADSDGGQYYSLTLP